MAELPPPEDSPVPEAPKNGVKVEISQPEMIYAVATNIVSGNERFSVEISNTKINDKLFKSEETELHGFKKDNPRVGGTFNFHSKLYNSDEKINGEDHGYYSQEKVQKINSSLIEKGVRSTFVDNPFGNGTNLIRIERDGCFFEVYVGYPNRKAEEDYILSKVQEEKDRGEEGGFYTKYDLPKIQQGLVKDGISLGIVDQERYETSWEGYPKLEDQDSFSRTLSVYTDVYKQVLTTLYEVEGITPPDLTITLRPPIKNQDIFTQISSTSTEHPIAITAEQLQTEAVGFDDIAGQDFAVAEAKRLVLAINHPEIFEKRGVKRPKGILFYGPPGTGKTLIAKAVAKEANAEFLQVSAADIGTKWYGESERLMQEVFNIANKNVAQGKKVVLFFDEIDSLAPSREDSHEATRKVVATLLQNIDGMKANPNVTVLAATNRPQDIDSALKRPGRFDKLIPLELPNAEGREAILKVHMQKAKGNSTDPDNMFSPDINLAEITQGTNGMSGADLANLVNLTLEDKTMAELSGQPWTPITAQEMSQTAKRLGLLKEERRKIGFIQPNQNGEQK